MMNAFDGFKPSPYGLYETAATVNNSWGYCAWDQNWKSAREIADITVSSDDLYQIVTLKLLSDSLMERIKKNYRRIVGFNSLLIVLGVTGVIQPTTSALLHNSSTLLIGLESMQNLLD